MRLVLLGPIAALLVAFPATAREPAAREPDRQAIDRQVPDKPVTGQDVSAADVAATPVTDLNLRKNEIPQALTAAELQAYSLRGVSTCQQISQAIVELDAALGDDVDLPQSGERRTSSGRLAQSVVGSFIPFRGVIREVSGANSRERELQSAVLAGMARRAFLKGTGQARGCRYPARSATLDVFNRRMAELDAAKDRSADSKGDANKQP